MNILVVVAVAVVLGILRLPPGESADVGTRLVGGNLRAAALRVHARRFPRPWSMLYMGIITIAILAYVTSSRGAPRRSVAPAGPFMTEKKYAVLLAVTVVALPVLAAANVYVQMNVPLEPPFFARTVHPASPSEITVHDKKIDLDTGENPFLHLETSNPDGVPEARRERERVYYRNCVFCHGDDLSGNGMFVHGL